MIEETFFTEREMDEFRMMAKIDELEQLAASRLELLRRCKEHIEYIVNHYKEYGFMFPNIALLEELIDELAEAIRGDEGQA